MNTSTLHLFGINFNSEYSDYEIKENLLQKYLDVLSPNHKHIVYTNDTLCGPGNFNKFRNLKSVILTGNQITEISELPSTVEYLDISNNCLNNFHFRQSMALSNLKYLNISNNNITDFIQWNMPLEKIICYGNPNLNPINFREGLQMLDCDYNFANKIIIPESLKTLYICGEEQSELLAQLRFRQKFNKFFYS